jgi:hypothetical protein
MGSLRHATRELFTEVEAALLAEMERVGPDKMVRADVARQFLARGVDRATLFRWIGQIIASGRPGQRLAKKVREAAASRAARVADPAASAAAEFVAAIPAPPTIDTADALPFLARLQGCLARADEMIAHAKTEDGKVRNSRLLLAASEHVRRTLATAARIQDGLMEVSQVERFHQAIFDMLREESPAFAEKVLIRLRQINATWGVS